MICNTINALFIYFTISKLHFHTNIGNISLMLLVVAGFSMKTTSNTAQELSSSFLSLQMRLFIFVYFMHLLSTALSYKGCIINLIVCISCSLRVTCVVHFLHFRKHPDRFILVCIM